MQRLLRPWRNLAASMWTNMSLKFTWTRRTSWWPPVPSCATPPFTKSTTVSEKWWKKWSDLPECHKATESSSSGERALGLALPLSYPHVKRQTAARSSSPHGPLVAPEGGELEQCKRWHAWPRTRHLLRWSWAGSNWSVTRSHCHWFWAAEQLPGHFSHAVAVPMYHLWAGIGLLPRFVINPSLPTHGHLTEWMN